MRTIEIQIDANIHGIVHGHKWIIFHGLLGIASGTSKRGESNVKLGTWQIAIGSYILKCHGEVLDNLQFWIIHTICFGS